MSIDADVKAGNIRLLDLVEKRYNYELQRWKDLDSKANNLIGYVSVITTLILGIGAFQFLSGNLLEKGYSTLYFVGIFALVFSIVASLIAMLARNYHLRPNYGDVVNLFRTLKVTEINIIRSTITEMNDAAHRNSVLNNQKGICILIGNALLIVGIIFLLSYTTAYTYEIFNSNHTDTTNKTIVSTLSQLDEKTLNEFFTGKKKIEINPNDTLNILSPLVPNTNSPWVETEYEWLKDNLNVYIITDPESIDSQTIAAKAINKWVDLLKSQSKNSSTWNVSIYKIVEGNYSLFKDRPPDITLNLYSDPNASQCKQYYGKAGGFHEDKDPQYAKIFTSCEGKRLSNESIYTIVLHEFGHTIGLGHAHNKNGDLLCSTEEDKQTCAALPGDQTEPSNLDINAALYIYGMDGFGAFNRILVNKPYYVESLSQN